MSDQREALRNALHAQYLKDCDDNAIVPDHASAFNFVFDTLSSAPSAEPALYMARNKSNKKFYATSFSKAEAELFLAQSSLKNDGVEAEVLALYTATPHLSAAIAAAREQDARLCAKVAIKRVDGSTVPTLIEHNKAAVKCSNAIRAQQDPDGLAALREMISRAVYEALDRYGYPNLNGNKQDIANECADRALKGE